MQILWNERALDVEPSARADELITEHYGTCTQGLALAINNTVVPRSQWSDTSFQDGDRVLVVQAVQGG